jgi:hypothetical protein
LGDTIANGRIRRDLPFVDRITRAIARFERTRKLDPERRDIFYKYLAFGGLSVGPNVGQGGVDTAEMDKAQIAMTLSQVFASHDKYDLGTETSIDAVDFLGCLKAFCSYRLKGIWGLETKEQVIRICTTLERFMDYLLQHDVCPDFKDDVLASRAFCRTIGPELWDMAQACRRLPGEFNMACSTLFGGLFGQHYDGDTWWGREDEKDPVFVGLKPEEAQTIVKFGVAGAAEEQVYLAFLDGVQGGNSGMLDVIDVKEATSFEITQIELPTKQCKEIYTTQSVQYRPVGRVTAKPCTDINAVPEDLTDAERQAVSSLNGSTTQYVFLIEEILSSMLRVGTKIEATVRILRCGIMFFDEVLNVHPSYAHFIPNELMTGWKEPRRTRAAFDYVSEDDADEEEDDGRGPTVDRPDVVE